MKDQDNISSAEKIVKLSLSVMEECESKNTLDDALDRIRSYDYAKTVTDILFNYFRNRAKTDFMIAKFADNGKKKIPPKFKRILNIAVTQIFFQSGIKPEIAVDVAVTVTRKKYGRRPAGFINAVLRRIADADIHTTIKDAPEHVKLNIPETIYTRWKSSLPELLENLKNISAAQVPLTFRKSGKISEEELKEAKCYPLPLPEWADGYEFYTSEEPSLLFKKTWLNEGKIYIQDPSTLSPCNLYTHTPENIVLDLCSAPGGKTVILAEKMKNSGVLIASDLSLNRQKRTLENIRSHNIENCSVITASALHPPFPANIAELIFLDVPCSNSGVFRRRPDTLWNFTEKKLNELAALQRKILKTAADLVKPDGELIYSTCSIEPEENCMQIESFIKRNPDFTLLKERQILPSDTHDGGYAALIRKES